MNIKHTYHLTCIYAGYRFVMKLGNNNYKWEFRKQRSKKFSTAELAARDFAKQNARHFCTDASHNHTTTYSDAMNGDISDSSEDDDDENDRNCCQLCGLINPQHRHAHFCEGWSSNGLLHSKKSVNGWF